MEASAQAGNASLPSPPAPPQTLCPCPPPKVSWLPSRPAHPGVVAGVELLCHGRDVLHQELVPLPLKADLVHVDVDGGHVFVAALDAAVLEATQRGWSAEF